MIYHLDGGYETVQYRQKSHLRLYYNNKSEHFPPHWHNDIEIINVLKGKLVVRCLANSYTIHEGEILIICPTSIHEIFDEPSGVRFYIQANSLRDGHGLFHPGSGSADYEGPVP